MLDYLDVLDAIYLIPSGPDAPRNAPHVMRHLYGEPCTVAKLYNILARSISGSRLPAAIGQQLRASYTTVSSQSLGIRRLAAKISLPLPPSFTAHRPSPCYPDPSAPASRQGEHSKGLSCSRAAMTPPLARERSGRQRHPVQPVQRPRYPNGGPIS